MCFLSYRGNIYTNIFFFKFVGRSTVEAFYAAAMKAKGAVDNGGPGLRPEYGPTYYAAFVKDPMGNNIEAICTGDSGA